MDSPELGSLNFDFVYVEAGAPFLLPREEVQDGRPITPPPAGHVGRLCTAGLLNGVFGQGSDRHIARWRTVKSVTVFEMKENGFKEIHKRERFTDELALIRSWLQY